MVRSCSTTSTVLPRAREIAQQREQPLVVLRMEADGRLVEHVEGRGQARAERRREVNALGLAARERARLAVERQVVEADPVQHREAFARSRRRGGRRPRARARRGAARRTRPGGPRPRARAAPAACGPANRIASASAFNRPPQAVGAGVVGAVARQQHAHVDAVGAALEPAEERLEVGEAPLPAPEPVAVLGRELAAGPVERHLAPAGGAQEPVVELLVGRSVPRRDRPLERGSCAGSGITRSGSIPITRPKPSQVGQAPSGELKENSAGDGARRARPQTGQARSRQ